MGLRERLDGPILIRKDGIYGPNGVGHALNAVGLAGIGGKLSQLNTCRHCGHPFAGLACNRIGCYVKRQQESQEMQRAMAQSLAKSNSGIAAKQIADYQRKTPPQFTATDAGSYQLTATVNEDGSVIFGEWTEDRDTLTAKGLEALTDKKAFLASDVEFIEITWTPPVVCTCGQARIAAGPHHMTSCALWEAGK